MFQSSDSAVKDSKSWMFLVWPLGKHTDFLHYHLVVNKILSLRYNLNRTMFHVYKRNAYIGFDKSFCIILYFSKDFEEHVM